MLLGTVGAVWLIPATLQSPVTSFGASGLASAFDPPLPPVPAPPLFAPEAPELPPFPAVPAFAPAEPPLPAVPLPAEPPDPPAPGAALSSELHATTPAPNTNINSDPNRTIRVCMVALSFEKKWMGRTVPPSDFGRGSFRSGMASFLWRNGGIVTPTLDRLERGPRQGVKIGRAHV